MITDYLSFTKGSEDVTISVNRHFHYDTAVEPNTDLYVDNSNYYLEYSYDKHSWYKFTWQSGSTTSNSITLNSTRPTVYMRGLAFRKFRPLTFNITGGNVYADGDIMSIARYGIEALTGTTNNENDCGFIYSVSSFYLEHVILPYEFYGLFSGCTNLVTSPKMSANVICHGGCCSMFEGCTSLTNSPPIRVKTLSYKALYRMFYGCSKINSATLYARYKEDDSLTDWLYGTSNSGILNVNNELHFSFGSNDKPTNWTTSVIPETANIEEFSSEELIYMREKLFVLNEYKSATDSKSGNYNGQYQTLWHTTNDNFTGEFRTNASVSSSSKYYECFLPGMSQLRFFTSTGALLSEPLVPTRSTGERRNYYMDTGFYSAPSIYLWGAITECGFIALRKFVKYD